MYKIIIPQSNTNDTEVFIAEWKFSNNDLVKKGDHLFSIETSKVVEEIYSENTGYLHIECQKGSRVKVGSLVGYLSKEKKNDVHVKNNFKENENLIITKKAKNQILENKINTKVFQGNDIVTEEIVKKYLASTINDEKPKYDYQLIILLKNDNPYHACIFFKNHGIIDLSLLGSKIQEVNEYNFSECKCIFLILALKIFIKLLNFTQNLRC